MAAKSVARLAIRVVAKIVVAAFARPVTAIRTTVVGAIRLNIDIWVCFIVCLSILVTILLYFAFKTVTVYDW